MSAAERVYRGSPPWLQTVLLNAHALRIERHRYGPRCSHALDALLEQDRWPAERLRALQDSRLRAIIRHAYAHSPWYRRTLDEAGVRPAMIRGIADLPLLPLLRRADVREHAAALATGGSRRGWLHGGTSGTTGSPLSLWYDRATCVMTNAVDLRQKRWAGVGPGEWIGVLLGRIVVPTDHERPPFWRTNAVQRQLWLSSFHMSPDTLPLYVEELRRRRIAVLEGYPSAIYTLARFLAQRGAVLPMKAVFTSSETLHGVQREVMERAFGCPVFDYYGLAERVVFATECEYHYKHIAEEYGHAEITDSAGRPVPDGQPGFLTGTSLHNTAMPMIRYVTSDITRIEPGTCPCGRTLRRMADVTTRAEDAVLRPDGRVIPPPALTHAFKPYPGILRSQLIQETATRVRVKVVADATFGAPEERGVVELLRERLGPDMAIEIEHVAEIPAGPGGKFRWVVSNVAHEGCMPPAGAP